MNLETVEKALGQHAESLAKIYARVSPVLTSNQQAKVRQLLQRLRDEGRAIQVPDVGWMAGTKVCPKCGEMKSIRHGFGLRRGGTATQPYCYKCRNTNAHDPQRRLYETPFLEAQVARLQMLEGQLGSSSVAKKLKIGRNSATRVIEAGLRAGVVVRSGRGHQVIVISTGMG